MQRPVVLLPLPDSPTSAERLALVDREADAVHRLDDGLRRATARRRARSASRGCGPRRAAGSPAALPDNRGLSRVAPGPTVARVRVQIAAHGMFTADRRHGGTPHLQIAMRRGQRGANAQPGGSAARFGTTPSIAFRRAPALPPESTPAARACTGAPARGRSSRTGPSSTMRPAYITATRSAISAITPRSWVMSSSDRSNCALHLAQQVEDLRLHGDVERGGRLVGDDERRLAGQRHGDHHALAHAARQLVRVVVDALLGIDDLHGAQQLDRAVARLALRRPCRARPALRRSACRRASPG